MARDEERKKNTALNVADTAGSFGKMAGVVGTGGILALATATLPASFALLAVTAAAFIVVILAALVQYAAKQRASDHRHARNVYLDAAKELQ